MGNVQAVIDLPEELYLALLASGLTREKIASESRKLLAWQCFRDKLLSLGTAVLSGLSKWDFIAYLSESGVAVVDYDEDEFLTREFGTAESLATRLKK